MNAKIIIFNNICKILFLFSFLIYKTKSQEEYDICRAKSIRMSNTHGIIEHGEASNCLDRNANTICSASYYHDYESPEHINSGSWIQIDLKGIYNISKIIICSPDSQDSDFSGAFDIFVRMNNSLRTGEDALINLNYIPRNRCFNFTKFQGFLGQFVTLKKNDIRIINDYATLVFSEVIIVSQNPEYEIVTLKNAQQNLFERNTESRPERGERRRVPPRIFFHDIALDQSYHASNAIDGKPETCNFDNDLYAFVLHLDAVDTKNETGWWSVDMGDVYEVSAVQIENSGRRSSRFANTKIDINLSAAEKDAAENTTRQLCYSMDNKTFTIGHNSIFNCLPNVSGRFLTITKTGGTKMNVLYLCEVSVYILHKAPLVDLSRLMFKEKSYTSAIPSTTRIQSFTQIYPARTSKNCPICKSPEDCSSHKIDKVIIGVVVAMIVFILGIFVGFFIAIKRYNMDKTTEKINPKNVFFDREMRSPNENIHY